MMATLFTVLGIGLLLLLHEAGHYYAARAVGIKVHVFSLGFGPKIVEWRYNDCDFRLAWIPLGGYVRVAGEDPNVAPKPGDLFYASAPKRLLFYSGGIIINFLFAFLLIPILFMVGVPFEAPVIGSVNPGEAAWEAGVQAGDRVIEVDGRTVYGFRHVHSSVALAPREAPIEMVVVGLDGETRHLQLTPEYNSEKGFQGIGANPFLELRFKAGTELAKAAKGAAIQSVNGVPSNSGALFAAILEDARQNMAPLQVTYLSDDGILRAATVEASMITPENAPDQIGIAPLRRKVETASGPLDQVFLKGTELVRVNQREIRGRGDVLLAIHAAGGLESFAYLPDGPDSTPVETVLEAPILMTSSDASSNLHLTATSEVRYSVYPGSAAERAGLEDGCRILRVDDEPVPSFEELRSLVLGIEPSAQGETKITLDVIDPGEQFSRKVDIALAPIPGVAYDLEMQVAMEKVRTNSPLRAVSLGFLEAKSMVGEVLTTLQRMVSGSIDKKNLGGIISIGTATHSFASQGLIPLFFFLCMISVNLGVLNLMPIPALDGGHIVFALYEIIVRRPVSMAVQNGFQVIGVFVVLFLLIFVTTMDIQRLFA
ncbi:MAG: site-2 protease family protein [Planctomycetota bacterium]|nr:site-2 protease family protein [Planctomycetota bacterium]